MFKKVPMTGFAFHEALLNGLPVTALTFLLKHMTYISSTKLAETMGLGLRAAKRRASSSTARLTRNQSERLWIFAKLLCLANHVFGEQQNAEQWLCSPTKDLKGRVPIDLLETRYGAEIVEKLLMQLGWEAHGWQPRQRNDPLHRS